MITTKFRKRARLWIVLATKDLRVESEPDYQAAMNQVRSQRLQDALLAAIEHANLVGEFEIGDSLEEILDLHIMKHGRSSFPEAAAY